MNRCLPPKKTSRRAAAVVFSLGVILLLLGLAALSVDVGRMMLFRTHLQQTTDAVALATASELSLALDDPRLAAFEGIQVERGIWDPTLRTFTAPAESGNAVRVISRPAGPTQAGTPRFFAGIFNPDVSVMAAVAVAAPRDIVFVVDLSGSMNDDSEPCRADDQTNDAVGQLYEDLGLGPFPGPLETVREEDAYRAIVEGQIARLMPRAVPTPQSEANVNFWHSYLDYVSEPSKTLEPFRNQIGYRTYVQFLLDQGRDLKPSPKGYAPLSQHSSHCPWREEETAAGTFSFPPRSQPMHAVRRSLIAALEAIERRNDPIGDRSQRDRVSLVSFDTLVDGGAVVRQPLSDDYRLAMHACTSLQAVGDKGATSATEAGLILAAELLTPASRGGDGREHTEKLVILLTDGTPDDYASDPVDVDTYLATHASDLFYRNGAYCLDAPLMQVSQMRTRGWRVVPVAVGRSADHEFTERMAQVGLLAGARAESHRTDGDPAEYERRLTEVLERVISTRRARIVR